MAITYALENTGGGAVAIALLGDRAAQRLEKGNTGVAAKGGMHQRGVTRCSNYLRLGERGRGRHKGGSQVETANKRQLE